MFRNGAKEILPGVQMWINKKLTEGVKLDPNQIASVANVFLDGKLYFVVYKHDKMLENMERVNYVVARDLIDSMTDDEIEALKNEVIS